MAADLYIYTIDQITEDEVWTYLECRINTPEFKAIHARIKPNGFTHIGEVSWLSAAFFGSPVPGPVQQVVNVLDRGVIRPIDDSLIVDIGVAMDAPNTTDYGIADKDKVLSFLEERRGMMAFTVSY